MTSFLVLGLEGDVPEGVVSLALTAAADVVRSYGTEGTVVNADLLIEGAGGSQRRRWAVLNRMYDRLAEQNEATA